MPIPSLLAGRVRVGVFTRRITRGWRALLLLIDLTISHRVAVLTLNRPEALNAINQTLLDDLEAALHAVAADDGVAVVIVTGAGRAFCAGSDVKELDGVPPAEAGRMIRREAEVCRLFEEIPQPTIAAIEGYALGGGAGLALYQNMRIAGETAMFGFPEVKLGWNPAFGMARLTRLIGEGHAAYLMMSGHTIDASEALQIRLVDRVVSSEKLMEVTREMAERIARNPATGVQAIKKIMQGEALLSPYEADDYELRAFVECIDTEDARKRIRAFASKRLKGKNGKG